MGLLIQKSAYCPLSIIFTKLAGSSKLKNWLRITTIFFRFEKSMGCLFSLEFIKLTAHLTERSPVARVVIASRLVLCEK